LPSEGAQQQCYEIHCRGRTSVLAYYGTPSACVKGGTGRDRWMHGLGPRRSAKPVCDAPVNTCVLPGNISRAQQRQGTQPRLAHSTKTPLTPNISDTHTHIHAVRCTSKVGWTSNVAPPARPCTETRSTDLADLGHRQHHCEHVCVLLSEGAQQQCCEIQSRGRTSVLA